MIQTAYWYLHTDQFRYDHVRPPAPRDPGSGRFAGQSTADLVAQSARLGWMPSYPTFDRNPLDLADERCRRSVGWPRRRRSLKAGR